jgi:hypothetical protein
MSEQIDPKGGGPVVAMVTMAVIPAGATLQHERVIRVCVEHDSNHHYVEITQRHDTIRIDRAEWPALRRTIEHALETAEALG